jgi:hypothetical protein
MEATSSVNAKLPSECTPAILSFEGKVVRIHLEGTSTRAAILISDALSRLVQDFSITLTATICGKKARSITIRDEEVKSKTLGPRLCSVRVIVYGILDEKDAVADALSEGGLFLQHPGEAEFDREVKYVNPQYLLPPGENMPPIENLRISRCCVARDNTTSIREKLGELDKGRILSIFDSSFNFDARLVETIKPSPRVRTSLKWYTRLGIRWLILLINDTQTPTRGACHDG